MGFHHWTPQQILDMAWDDIVYAHEGTARYAAREAQAIKEGMHRGK